MFMKRNKCSGISTKYTERNDDLKLFLEDKQILIFSTNNIILLYACYSLMFTRELLLVLTTFKIDKLRDSHV